MIVETPGYFYAPDGTPLYGVSYLPQNTAAVVVTNTDRSTIISPPLVPEKAVLLVPPFFEERKSSYAALTALARTLAAAGYPVLRFDFRGSGESGGDPGKRSWSDLENDLRTALALARSSLNAQRLVVIGLRLGATLILQASARLELNEVIAIAPIVRGSVQERHWRLRTKLRTEMTGGSSGAGEKVENKPVDDDISDLDGFQLGKTFLSELRAIDLLTVNEQKSFALGLIQVSFRAEPLPETAQLTQAWEPRVSRFRQRCLKLEAFWDRVDGVETESLQTAVLDFLKA